MATVFVADALRHTRTMMRKSDMRFGRRWCPYCRGSTRVRATHIGLANGAGMMSGCEWHVRMWVCDPLWSVRRRQRERLTPSG